MGTLNSNDELLVYRSSDDETYRTPVGDLSKLSATSVEVSETPPNNPSQGNLWFDSTKGSLFVYYEDPDTSQWTDSFAGALPSALVGSGGTSERPTNPSVGDLFLDTDLNAMIYWDGAGWVILGGAGASGANCYTSVNPPPVDIARTGDLWFSTGDGRLYIYLRDAGGSLQWLDASPSATDFPVVTRNEVSGVISPVFESTLNISNITIPLDNNQTLDVKSTIESLKTLVEQLQARVATLEGN